MATGETSPVAFRPPVLPRAFMVLVGLAAAFIVVTGLRGLSSIIGPTFLALVLTIAAQPLRPWVERRGLPGWVGSVLGILVIYAVMIGLTVSLLVAAARFATLLPDYQDDANEALQDVVTWLNSVGVGDEQIDRVLDAFDFGQLVSVVGNLLSGLFDVLSGLLFIVTLVLFMVADAAGFPRRLLQLPPERRQLAHALASFAAGTRKYLIVSTVFGLIVAVFDTIALFWIGVPVAVLWGLLAFITNYIPNIGFVIGVVPPAVIGLLEGGPGMMLAVLVSYSVLNVVIQTVIQPKVVGDAVGLSSTITMLSLVFWAFTLGAVGALMAVPLSLLTKALLIDADPRTEWVGRLISSAGATSADQPADRASPSPDVLEELPGGEETVDRAERAVLEVQPHDADPERH